jgi:hypothetical protein
MVLLTPRVTDEYVLLNAPEQPPPPALAIAPTVICSASTWMVIGSGDGLVDDAWQTVKEVTDALMFPPNEPRNVVLTLFCAGDCEKRGERDHQHGREQKPASPPAIRRPEDTFRHA